MHLPGLYVRCIILSKQNCFNECAKRNYYYYYRYKREVLRDLKLMSFS